MRKTIVMVLILALLFAFGACEAQNIEPKETQLEESDDDMLDMRIKIGFSFPGDDAFYQQLQADIEQLCARLDYAPVIRTSATSAQQQTDIMTLLNENVAVMVIDPVDVDALETVLAECEIMEVPVVNVRDMINGIVSTLISPDYMSAGEMAAQRARALFSDTDGKCMVLKYSYDSFIMQLLTDGFSRSVDGNNRLTLVSEVFSLDEQTAYDETKDKIRQLDVNFVFAQNPDLARGAMRAIDESGSDVKLVVFSGEMELVKLVQSGKIDAAIFFGSMELARYAVGVADEYIKSVTYEPAPYIELSLNVVTADNSVDFVSGGTYAQAKEQQE